MQVRGGDGSKAPEVREVAFGRLKGQEQKAVTKADSAFAKMVKQVKSRNN